MKPTSSEGRRPVITAAWLVVRALRSAGLIAMLALALFGLRRPDTPWRDLGKVARSNLPLFAVVVLVVLIWDARAARNRCAVSPGRTR